MVSNLEAEGDLPGVEDADEDQGERVPGWTLMFRSQSIRNQGRRPGSESEEGAAGGCRMFQKQVKKVCQGAKRA